MKTTIKQQIKAVQRARAKNSELRKTDSWQEEQDALQDAVVTLSAVTLVGEHRIQLLPSLIEAATRVCKEYDDDVESYVEFTKLQNILNQLK